jgi:hypothetical protein
LNKDLKRILYYSKKLLKLLSFIVVLIFSSFGIRRKQKYLNEIKRDIICLEKSESKDLRKIRLLKEKRQIIESKIIDMTERYRLRAETGGQNGTI